MPFPQAIGLVVLIVATCGLCQSASGQPGGGPSAPDQRLVEKYDKDADGVLNTAERKEARTFLEENPTGRRRGRGPGRGRGGQVAGGKPGPKVEISDATTFTEAEFYDPTTLRTLFLEFEADDWEKELAAFKPTDVEVPAKLTVDGKVYPNVGVSFRGASSFFRISEGLKRSLNISIDFMDKKQRLYGYKSLNLLNSNGDAGMTSSALYSHISGQKIPTAKVNHVHVVINGESWGVYVSSQQFNKTFVKEHFETGGGARWKVSGSPRGDGGLRYLGEDIAPYRERFEIKSKDKEESWRSLINLCRVLNETPADKLEAALDPILDIDGTLWFLAVDVALVNSDGYWTRASDYNIYLDPDGKFHILPHDMNEAFQMGGRGGGPGGPGGGRRGGGPPRGGGPGGPDDGPQGGGGRRGGGGPPRGGGGGHGGTSLDPLVGLDNDADIERKPLRGRLLKNPQLQQRYLQHVKSVAQMLQWKNLGPKVEQIATLIEKEVARDTRKLSSTSDFRAAVDGKKPGEGSTSLRAFAEQRSTFLLQHEKIKNLPAP